MQASRSKQKQPVAATMESTKLKRVSAATTTPTRARGARRLVRSTRVNTNVALYDRKDPYTAVDALRKLLTVLPTRVGSAQLKMTAEEHKLSMHLLSIIEPVRLRDLFSVSDLEFIISH